MTSTSAVASLGLSIEHGPNSWRGMGRPLLSIFCTCHLWRPAWVLTRERPLLFKTRPLPGPVFAFGKQGSGLTALAMALSMLGYRCCSDVTDLPVSERDKLFTKKRRRVFDAYVNVGSLGPRDYLE